MDFLKRNFLWIITIILGMFMLSELKNYYIYRGRAEVEQEFRDKLNLLTIQSEEKIHRKERLLERAVKDRLNEQAAHKTELGLRDYKFAKYKEKTRFEFQELKLELSKVQRTNENLRQDLIQTKALNLSLNSINKNLLLDWEISDQNWLRNFDKMMKETTAATEQKYIDFINKIDRIKKRVR